METAIRRAAPADLAALVALWKEMWEAHVAADPRMAAGAMAEMVMRRWMEEHVANDRAEVLVAEDDGRVVGYALGLVVENPPVVPQQIYGYVSDLSVTAGARGRGIGGKLAEALLARFRERGLPYVQVQVGARNRRARDFWRRLGYSEFTEQLRLEL